jgi:hypothetical protein
MNLNNWLKQRSLTPYRLTLMLRDAGIRRCNHETVRRWLLPYQHRQAATPRSELQSIIGQVTDGQVTTTEWRVRKIAISAYREGCGARPQRRRRPAPPAWHADVAPV